MTAFAEAASIMDAILSRISAAALFVKVRPRIAEGEICLSLMRWAMRIVKTLVFPLPAPARIKTRPSVVETAFL
jgi:hypothetical protein